MQTKLEKIDRIESDFQAVSSNISNAEAKV